MVNKYAHTVLVAEPRTSGAQLQRELRLEYERQLAARIKANERAYEAELAAAEVESAGWCAVTAGEIEGAVTREGWGVLADRVMEAGAADPVAISDRQFKELCAKLQRKARRERWSPEPYFAEVRSAPDRLLSGYLAAPERKVR